MMAMVLAAGRGERLRPVTDGIPKALIEVRGEVLLERHLRAIASAGVDSIVINLGWLGDQIVERVGSGSEFGLNVIYSPEGDNILETGGGIHRALPMLGNDPFLVVRRRMWRPNCRATWMLLDGEPLWPLWVKSRRRKGKIQRLPSRA